MPPVTKIQIPHSTTERGLGEPGNVNGKDGCPDEWLNVECMFTTSHDAGLLICCLSPTFSYLKPVLSLLSTKTDGE